MQPPTPTQPPGPQTPYQYPYPTQPPGPYTPGYYPQPGPLPPPRRSHTALYVVVIIVVVAVVAALAIAVEYRSASLVVTVTSNHITNTISYVLDVDGSQVDSGVLTPGQAVQKTVPLAWWIDSCTYHTASATSTGGALGPESDSAAGTVCSGQVYTASLSV
jgi:hypothetical protein